MSQIKNIRYFKEQKCQNHKEKVVYIYQSQFDNQSQGLCIKCIGEQISDLIPIDEAFNMLSMAMSEVFQETAQINLKNQDIITKFKENLINIKQMIQNDINNCIQNIEQQLELISQSIINQNQIIDELLNCDITELEMYNNLFQQQLIDYRKIKQFLIESLQNLSTNKFIQQNQVSLNDLQINDAYHRLNITQQFATKINPNSNILQQNWKCLKHQQQIFFIDLNEQITIPNRIACLDCVPEHAIKYTKLQQFYEDWQQLSTLLETSVKSIQYNYNQNRSGSIESLQNLRNYCNIFIDTQISSCNSSNININQLNSEYAQLIRKEWLSLTQKEIILIADTLSQKQKYKNIKNQLESELIQEILKNYKLIETQFKVGQKWINEELKKIPKCLANLNQVDKNLEDNYNTISEVFLTQFNEVSYQLIHSIEEEEINSFDFSKDNQLLIIGFNSGIIRIYEFQHDKLQQIQELSEHDEYVCFLQFMKQSSSFISGSLDCNIIIWSFNNLKEWYCQQRLLGHSGCINCIISNFNDDFILSCSFDHTIKCWIQDIENNWVCHQTLDDHINVVQSLSLNQSQTQFISCSNDSTILIYQRQLNDLLWILIQTIQVEQLGFRLCFINDYLFTFQKQFSDHLEIYEYKNQKFTNTNQVYVEGIGECWLYFQQKFIQSKRLLMNKNGCFLNILKLNDEDQFENKQSIKFRTNNFFGQISDDGKYLIT